MIQRLLASATGKPLPGRKPLIKMSSVKQKRIFQRGKLGRVDKTWEGAGG